MLGLASAPLSVGPESRSSERADRARAERAPTTRRFEPAAGPDSDTELLRRYRDDHDESAFNELVRRYAGELHRYLDRYLRDRVPAEDVLQSTFLQIHRKVALFRDCCTARAWLYSIATNQAIDALRRARRTLPAHVRLDPGSRDEDGGQCGPVTWLADSQPEPLDALQREEQCQWVRERVAALPEPSRAVLLMAYYDGLKYQEIADTLQLPLGTVKSRLHLAVIKLREKAAG